MFVIELVVEAVLSWIKRSARAQQPSQDGIATYFGLCWQLKALVTVICGGFSVVIWMLSSRPALILVMLGIPTAIVMLLPRRVMVTPMELRQKSWSRGETRIASADVVSTHEDPDGNVTVYAKDGSQILFSAYLVSQPQFMQDLARYAPIQPTAVN